MKQATDATVAVYNVLGQKVTTLYDGTPQAGQSQSLSLRTDDLPSGEISCACKRTGRAERSA